MPAAYLLDLYDTLAHGDWISWREELASITGLSQDAIGDAYERTRAARNRGEFESPAGDVAAILDAAGPGKFRKFAGPKSYRLCWL